MEKEVTPPELARTTAHLPSTRLGDAKHCTFGDIASKMCYTRRGGGGEGGGGGGGRGGSLMNTHISTACDSRHCHRVRGECGLEPGKPWLSPMLPPPRRTSAGLTCLPKVGWRGRCATIAVPCVWPHSMSMRGSTWALLMESWPDNRQPEAALRLIGVTPVLFLVQVAVLVRVGLQAVSQQAHVLVEWDVW